MSWTISEYLGPWVVGCGFWISPAKTHLSALYLGLGFSSLQGINTASVQKMVVSGILDKIIQ